MLGIPLLMAYFYGRLMWPSYPWKYKQITDTLSILTAVYFLWMIGRSLYLAWWRWTLEGTVQEVTEMLMCGEDFFKWTDKCLRLIQESELVARGFTLVSHTSPLSRLEQNKLLRHQRQCPQLRWQLFVTCRDCMIASKDGTGQLVTQHPLSVDRSVNFLAHLSLEEYGPCLQVKGENSDSQKHLEEVTDGFSVSAIKGINHVCKMQYSELCRCVVLRVLHSVESSENNNYPVTRDIQERFCRSVKELQTLHGYYSSVSSPPDTQPQKPDVSKMNDLDLAVHSLDLHLQAALLRVRKLSVLLKHPTNLDTESLSGQAVEVRNDQSQEVLLDQIKQELLACKGCWEEGLERLQKLYKYQPSQAKTSEMVHQQSVHTHCPVDTPPVDLFNTSPPIIEDEVFEAYIDDEVDVDPDYSWDEYLTPEEKERKRREKQEALRLLTELKSVISVRAEEMGRREKKAQERKYGVVSPENQCNDQGSKKSNDTEDSHQDARLNFDEHHSDRLNVSECEDDFINGELNLNEDLSCSESKAGVEQITCNECQNELKSGQNTGKENHEERLFSTGSEEGPVDCSLGNFPNTVPRNGVLPFQSPNFQFSSSLAAMAVARSRDFGLTEDTFGDSESDSGDSGPS
ncbi:vezatin-like isoform X2 [Ostrea edulis]|nr:vezatin-like isoform X2 [Ostrea edulis]XP_055999673.1 vezatin-like isoform X2 [Ostrea edulis]